jgi:hypothetical protein
MQSVFSPVSFGVDTVMGGAIPAVMQEIVPAAMYLLPTKAKQWIGEGLSYVNGIFEGRGFNPAYSEKAVLPSGPGPNPDWTYAGQGTSDGDFIR